MKKKLSVLKQKLEGELFFDETIKKFTPIVFTEMLRKWTAGFGYHPNDTIQFFKDLNYLCFAIGEKGCEAIETVTDRTEETNFLFLHKTNHKEQIDIV